MKTDFKDLAGQILTHVGGKDNVSSAAHCATRLRIKLKDGAKANKAAVEALPGVITVVESGGQFQVVIGDDVPQVYKNFIAAADIGQVTQEAASEPEGNALNRFINMVAKIFTPVLWTQAGAGLFKAFLMLLTNDNIALLDDTSQTYTILFASADAVFYFLPLFLALTAAKYFGSNQFTSLAIAAALVYPSIVALVDAGESVYFVGIPVVVLGYTYSVVPIILAVWAQSRLEKLLSRVLHRMVRNFMVPLLTLFVMVPLTLIVVGPITTTLATWIANAIGTVFVYAPWAAGMIMGGLWQVFVMFGLHWALVPMFFQELADKGYSLLLGPLPAAVLSQVGAGIAVLIRSRSLKRRELAGPSALSGFMAGITEPLIYGVTLPMKRPFYFGLVGGAVGGMIAAIGGSAASTMVFVSALALPAFLTVGSFTMQLIGCGIAIAIGFLLTLFFGITTKNDWPDDVSPAVDADLAPVSSGRDDVVEPASASRAHIVKTSGVASPVNGMAIPLDQVPDKVFASGALGSGLGIIPSEDRFYAPFDGTVATVFPTGHAFGIRSLDGVEVLIHIGIDTVQLDGKGFAAAVEQGQQVRGGDLLCTVDLGVVEAAGYDTTTVVVVTNSKQFAAVLPAETHGLSHGDTAIVIER